MIIVALSYKQLPLYYYTLACLHGKKKWNHFDLKIWVTGGTKIGPGIPSNWRIGVKLLGIPGRILVPPVTQIFRSKWLHFFFPSSLLGIICVSAKFLSLGNTFEAIRYHCPDPNENVFDVRILFRESVRMPATTYKFFLYVHLYLARVKKKEEKGEPSQEKIKWF